MASAVSPDWNVLLPDLLVSILALLPMRPRVLVTSLVCRRWRAASLKSITKQDLSGGECSAPLLPSVTSLSISVPNILRLPPLPPTITSLELFYNPHSDMSFVQRLSNITRLTRLHLCPVLLNAPFLTELELDFEAEPMVHFASIRMPLLKSLRLHERGDAPAPRPLLTLVSAHASQLTALSLDHAASLAFLPPMPLLTHFCACETLRGIFLTQATVQAHMPKLETLSVTLFGLTWLNDMPELYPYTAITDLTIERAYHDDDSVDTDIPLKCPRLRNLTLPRFVPDDVLVMLSSLESLTIDTSEAQEGDTLNALATASRLTHLSVLLRKRTASLVLPPLPQLRSLKLRIGLGQLPLLREALLPQLAVATRLCNLEITALSRAYEEPDHRAGLMSLLRAAESIGVRKITMHCDDGLKAAILRDVARYAWFDVDFV